MNKLAKGIFIAVAVIVVVVVLAVFGIGLYLESQGVQARLETALSDELRMPVKLGGVHFSPWGGLGVSGFVIPAGATPIGVNGGSGAEQGVSTIPKNFLEVQQVTARVLWRPLLAHRVVIRKLVIVQPSVVWPQTTNGRWRLPRFERTAVAPPGEVPATARKVRGKVQFDVEAARIEDATFRFLNRDGEAIAVFEGVTVQCPRVDGPEIRGSVVIRKITLRDRVAVENVSAAWSYSSDQLSLAQIDARVAAGSVRGTYRLRPNADGTPYTLDLLFDGVDLKRLLTEGGENGTDQNISGTLHGCLDLYGRHGEKNALAGSGHMLLRNGRMDQYPMLQLIGQALQIDELTSLELQQAQMDLRMGAGKAFVDSIVLESPNLSLTAQGEAGLDGKKVDLASALTINARIGRQLPGWVRQHFQPVAGTDRQSIRFHIGGTLSHPDADLMRVIVGEKIEKQVLDVYRRFIGGGGRKKKADKAAEKRPLEEPGAGPSAAPTPPAAPTIGAPATADTTPPVPSPSPAAPAPASLTP